MNGTIERVAKVVGDGEFLTSRRCRDCRLQRHRESHLMDGNKLDHAVHDMEIDTIQQRDAGIKPRNIYDKSSRTVAQAEERIRDIDRKYKQDLQELPAKQFTHIAILAGVWLGTCVSLYVMGWLIGWVIRGFRPKAA